MEGIAVKRAVAVTTMLMVLAISILSIEFLRPGKLLCPLRRALATLKIKLPVPELSARQAQQARDDSRRWKAEALQRFPNLQITPRPVPDHENGFLALWELESGVKPSAPLAALLANALEGKDLANAEAELAANAAWLAEIERIAALPGQSSVEMPAHYNGFLQVRPIKQAVDTLLLKSLLAARAKDEAEALRWMTAAGNLIDHIRNIETPYLLSETVCLITHVSRGTLIVRQILPALGPSANLAAWRRQADRGDASPQRLGVAIRGEWHTCMDHLVGHNIAGAFYQRMLPDPEALITAYTASMSRHIARLESASLSNLAGPPGPPTPPQGLSHEAREIFEVLDFGYFGWTKGYARSARIHACTQAVFDLLMQAAAGRPLDVAAATRDPMTGDPMVFDAAERTLDLPPAGPDTASEKPLKLPW